VKGLFITFEGPDGAGKTTQIRKLAESLQHDGYEIVVTREPGGTSISDQIRSILLSPDHKQMADQAEVLLYAASRAQHVHEKILPAIQRNAIVLCDRYIDASLAYQSYGLGIDEETVMMINRYASSGLTADRTYLLDIPVEESRSRLLDRASGAANLSLDRIELKEAEYHKRVREGFLQIYRRNRERICLLDAGRPEDMIAREILEDCKRFLKRQLSN
jgi:dTMP kinase